MDEPLETQETPQEEATQQPKRSLRRFVAWTGLSLAGVLTLGTLFVFSLTRAAPTWWRQYRAEDEALIQRATSIENDAGTMLYMERPVHPQAERFDSSELWAMGISDADASAWLTARLPVWLDSEAELPAWPDELSQMQIRFESGTAQVAVRVRMGKGDRIITTTLKPHIDESGSVWLKPTWVHIGRLPVPAAWLLSKAEEEAPGILPDAVNAPESAAFFDVMRGVAPLAREPVIGLDGGRQVRLVGLRLKEGRLELTCRTETRLAAR